MKKLSILLPLFVVCVLTLGLFGPLEAQAQDGLVPCGATGQPACNFCHIFAVVHNVVTFLIFPDGDLNNFIPLVLVVASFLFAWGGFYILTAAANPSNVQKGRTIIFATIVGLLIIYGAWLFLNLLFQALGFVDFQGLGDWWEIDCSK